MFPSENFLGTPTPLDSGMARGTGLAVVPVCCVWMEALWQRSLGLGGVPLFMVTGASQPQTCPFSLQMPAAPLSVLHCL